MLFLPLLLVGFVSASQLLISDVTKESGEDYRREWCRVPDYHIDHYLTRGRIAFLSEANALNECSNSDDCSGVVYEPEERQYTLRTGDTMSVSRSGSAISFVKGACRLTAPIPPTPAPTAAPVPVSGDHYCIEDCDSDQKFVNTWAKNGDDTLCTDTDVVQAIRGRGEEKGCSFGDWTVVEECQDCYEFVWRETSPYQCHVEDRFIWCCEPVITVTDAKMCTRSGNGVQLICNAKYNHHHRVKVNWVDGNGNNLAANSGFSVETYDADEDKKISILTIAGVDANTGKMDISCQVTDHEGRQWSEPADFQIFDVEAYSVVQPVGADTSVVCVGKGLEMLDSEFTLEWYKHVNGEWEKLDYDTVERSMGASGLYSALQIPKETLSIGDQVYQCALSYRGVQATECKDISYIQESSCYARAVVTIWEVPDVTECSMVGEVTKATIKVGGSTHDFSLLENEVSVREVNDLGDVIPTGDDVEIVKRNVGTRGEVSVTVTLNKPSVASVRYFKTEVNHKGETVSKVNFEFHVEDVKLKVHQNDGVDFYAEVILNPKEGTNLLSSDPAFVKCQWSDDEGNNFLNVNSEEHYHANSPLKMKSVDIPGDSVTTSVVISRDGERCGVISIKTPVKKQQCKIVYEDRKCEDRCAPYTNTQDWECQCADSNGVYRRSANSECARYDLLPSRDITYECPATVGYEMSRWVSQDCDNKDACYPYLRSRSRSCVCKDSTGTYTDSHGRCAAEGPLKENFECDAAQKFSLTSWTRGRCPSNTCTESSTIDTRACVCGDIRDRNQCGNAEMRRERTCAPTESFEWTDWGAEDCNSEELCHNKEYTKTRACMCQTIEGEGKCEGDDSTTYWCPANTDWVLRSSGACPDKDSCTPFRELISTSCECSAEGTVSKDRSGDRCAGQRPRAARLCPATTPYEWGPWVPVSQCDECFPDRQQRFVRECSCDGDLGDEGQCAGPAEKFEPCVFTAEKVWNVTPWSVIQECGALTCAEPETRRIRVRDCKCKNNIDNSQCPGEPLREETGCGFKPFALTSWSDVVCDRFVCAPDTYTKPKSRTCECTDGYHGRLEDKEQCNPGREGYEAEELCTGAVYEWGEWSGRNCPASCSIPTSTKRYRVCKCYDRIDFNRCDGSAIDFHQCDC